MNPIAIILGTRPEIIKMSPIISRCKEQQIDIFIIHTNQHYSQYLDNIFFEELNLPLPDYSLAVGSGTHGEQTGKMLQRIEKVFLEKRFSFVLVHGDTNTTLAGALSAAKLNIPVGHVESGLRSHDRKMPEELNRIVVDHLSNLCFVPTKNQEKILLNEGIDSSKIIITGNTVVDAINRNIKLIKDDILEQYNISSGNYLLATIHRAENVDDKLRLKQIFMGLTEVGKITNKTVILPLHPRTLKFVERFAIEIDPIIKIIEPVGYIEFLGLLKNTDLVLTDSGGIQEEACILNVPCVTVRENTERPETIEVGANILGGTTKESIVNASLKMINKKDKRWINPFGDGKSAERIIKAVLNYVESDS